MRSAHKAPETSEAPSPLPDGLSSFEAIAVVLVCETRSCVCGTSYHCPNHSPQALLRNARGTTRLVHFRPQDAALLAPLPRYVREVTTAIAACPHCFSDRDAAQLALFPFAAAPPTRPEPTWLIKAHERLAASKTPTPVKVSVDDFCS